MYGVLKSFGSFIVVCECYGSVIKMDRVLKNCGSVIVFCEYNEDVVVVYNKLQEGKCGCGEKKRN